MPYQIEWTEPAETSYRQIEQSAKACLDAGQDKHPAVIVFNEVEDALSALSAKPCEPSWALAGVLSMIYKMPLRSVYICYIIASSEPIVVVLTIARKQQSTRRWLSTAIENGTVDELLDELGIEKPCINIEVNERWTH